MKKNQKLYLILGVLAVGGGVGYYFYAEKQKKDAVDAAAAKAAALVAAGHPPESAAIQAGADPGSPNVAGLRGFGATMVQGRRFPNAGQIDSRAYHAAGF